MTQPQVSVALGRLRELFHDPLFVRTAQGMQPTPRAAAIVKSARCVLAQIDHEILADSGFDPTTTQRPFVFALSDAGEMTLLPKLLRVLRQAAPMAPIRSLSQSAPDIAAGLERGRIDLAIGYLPDLRHNNFFRQTLFSDSFECLLRADHPLTSRRLTMKQFLQFEHAVVQAQIRSQEVLDRYLARKRIQRRIGLLIQHVASLPIILAQSDMLATVPQRLAGYFEGLGANVRTVGLPFELPAVEIRQHWHRKFHDDPRNRWLRSTLARVFQQ